MVKPRIILVSVASLSIAVFAVQTLSQTRRPNRRVKPPDPGPLRERNMTPEEKREAAKRDRQRELERAQRERELAKEGRGPLISREQTRKESRKRAAERSREFFWEKSALAATEEQWKLIKPKLEKVRQLRDQGRQASSVVGLFLTSSSGSGTRPGAGARQNVPTWQWKRPWKNKAPGELTEAQKLAKELIVLVENKNTTPQAFRRKMAALRKARSEEAEIERQLSEAREELREILTTRQEAALVLMKWL